MTGPALTETDRPPAPTNPAAAPADRATARPPSRPPAAHRIGEPSPLIFHLSAALSAYAQALFAAPRADSPRFPWLEECAADAAALGPDLDQVEVAAEIAARLGATIRGLEIWQAHPYRRAMEEPPAIWAEGAARLIDYGAAGTSGPGPRDPAARPVLVVPSLINRPYVLDLQPERSLLRWLAARGVRPLLLDWGSPGPAEAEFSLDDYGAKRILPALDIARGLGGGPVPLLGYCMGGTLSAGVAARRPDLVERLVTIGAPWDFASIDGIAGGFRALLRAEGPERIAAMLETMGQGFGAVPVSLFQMLFAIVNPIQAAVKFQRLSRLDPESAEALHFVALEDWLSDGIPMAAPAARELLIDWQIRNLTARDEWHFLGGPARARAIRCPALVVAGRNDTIAPPALAEPLAAAIPGARLLSPGTGHVGMAVGTSAPDVVWHPVAEFLSENRP